MSQIFVFPHPPEDKKKKKNSLILVLLAGWLLCFFFCFYRAVLIPSLFPFVSSRVFLLSLLYVFLRNFLLFFLLVVIRLVPWPGLHLYVCVCVICALAWLASIFTRVCGNFMAKSPCRVCKLCRSW